MKIDFTSTAQNNQAEIEYYNVRGQIVKTYNLSDLENFVMVHGMNFTSYSTNGCLSSDPNIIEEEIELDLDAFIDNNWVLLTTKFYNFRNNEDFSSNNKPQQTVKSV